ncbi:MAG: hypothetical protein AAB152_08100 [Candidatus Coatesbacteria bacterium]
MNLPAWMRSSWFKNTVTVVVTALIAFQMARMEVVRRAKREFREGEKYYRWYLEPETKKKELAGLRDAKRMSGNEYEHLMEEDMYKEAVVWWQTVGDFYYLPHSRWVDQAEDQIWKTGQEHEARGWKKGLKTGRDDLEHALMSYKAIADSFKPLHGRRPGRHLEDALKKIAELEAKGLQWP